MRGGRSEKDRFRFLRIAMMVAGCVLALRMVHIQIIKHEHYRAKALLQWESLVSIPAERGNLYDRHMQPLALSVSNCRIGVSGSLVDKPDSLATVLAEVLHQDRGGIRQRIRKAGQSHFVLDSDAVLDAADQKRLRAFKAVTMEERQSRLYPTDGVGASLIGFFRSSPEHTVATGLELSLDDYLAGEAGLSREMKNADPLRKMGMVSVQEPVHGQSLVLSLDSGLQTVCEQELARSVKETRAKGGSVLIVDPSNGDILAAASWPLVKTRQDSQPDPRVWNNNIFTSNFEPGSVFKMFSAASLLKNGAIDTATVYNCDDDRVPGLFVHNAGGKDYGNMSLMEAIAKSTNVYWGKAMANLAKTELFRDLTDFGFGQPTAMLYHGQLKGSLAPVDTWSGRSKQTIAIGQEVSVTALQLGLAISSIANGGILYAPRMIREIRDDQGMLLEEIEPLPLRRVMTTQLASVLREAMGRVVLEGTGQGAGMDWITTGGKTGTAQKCVVPGEGFTPGAYVSSFAGIVPLDNPRLVILTVLDEPDYQHHYASSSAVPLYASIIKGIRRSTAWLTDVPGARTSPFVPRDSQKLVAVPDVLHLSVDKAAQRLGGAGFLVAGAEKSGVVIQQVPGPGTKCCPGQEITLAVADPKGQSTAASALCPDFLGMSNREVSTYAASLGIRVIIKGEGYAVIQSLDPGEMLAGKPVTIKMEPSWS